MIPQFPKWKAVDLDDREDLSQLALPFIPNADLSCALLWAWNREQNIKASRLNSHLLLRLWNPSTGMPCYAFAGNGGDEVNATAATLLDAAAELDRPSLRMIPEQVARRLDPDRFVVVNDPDVADYLVSAPSFAELNGPAYTWKRRSCTRFERDFSPTVSPLDLTDPNTQRAVLDISEKWHADKLRAGKQMDLNSPWGVGDDRVALERMMSKSAELNVIGLGVHIEGRLSAFALTELLPSAYAIVHFIKSESSCQGIQDFIFREMARQLWQVHHRAVINFEEDGGSEGLRKYKESLRPFAYLHKYTVTER